MMNRLDFEGARHLVDRAGFGPEAVTIKQLIGLTRQQAVAALLAAPRNHLRPQPMLQSFKRLREIRKTDKKNNTRVRRKLLRKDTQAAKNWAIAQALSNPNALQEKMWYWFISIESPKKAITQKWASTKSPLDLVVGTLRTLDLEDKQLPLSVLSKQLKRMGQDLYTPPNVKGWPGGTAWIDDARLKIGRPERAKQCE